MALDISKALDFIHTKAKLLHGDMKSFNILVNGDFVICKLCDFGVSLQIDENGLLDLEKCKEGYVGTECWSAPEVVNSLSTYPVSTKSEIFSFGLTLWEMLSLEPPHIGNFPEDDVSMEDSVILVEDSIMDDPSEFYGTRPAMPNLDEENYKDVLGLFYCMTEEIPQSRPSAHHITLCAEDMIAKGAGKKLDF